MCLFSLSFAYNRHIQSVSLFDGLLISLLFRRVRFDPFLEPDLKLFEFVDHAEVLGHVGVQDSLDHDFLALFPVG